MGKIIIKNSFTGKTIIRCSEKWVLAVTLIAVHLIENECLFSQAVNKVSMRKQKNSAIVGNANRMMEVGVARIDITPDGPIRLAGYGSRKSESEGISQRLNAKAIVFGSDEQGPSILITVDLIGIPKRITAKVAEFLSKKVGVDPQRLSICASHIHSGPIIGDIFTGYPDQPWPPEQFARVIDYADQLVQKLEDLALKALKSRSLSRVSWGQGQVGFATNRRVIKDGKWVGFGAVPDGPVDHSMSILRITAPDGQLRAVFVNYACHATTLGPDFNLVHGDWPGEAQRIIETLYPGAIALFAPGCGADADPQPRLKIEYTTMHGQEIADEVSRLLDSPLHALSAPPVARHKQISLPYDHVLGSQELVENAKDKGSKGSYARLALERLAWGDTIPSHLLYSIQTWAFSKNLVMIFLPGEVVVDYSLRLKKELGPGHLWINAYANDMPCYIASRRLISEGGYEVDDGLYGYDKPVRFAEGIEDMIIKAIYDLLPASFKTKKEN